MNDKPSVPLGNCNCSPRPWSMLEFVDDYVIVDANGTKVASPSGTDCLTRMINASTIVSAVNTEHILYSGLHEENARLRLELESAQGRGFARKLAAACAENKRLHADVEDLRVSRDRVDATLYAKTAEHSKMRDLVGRMKCAIEKLVPYIPKINLTVYPKPTDGHVHFCDIDFTALLSEAQAAVSSEAVMSAAPPIELPQRLEPVEIDARVKDCALCGTACKHRGTPRHIIGCSDFTKDGDKQGEDVRLEARMNLALYQYEIFKLSSDLIFLLQRKVVPREWRGIIQKDVDGALGVANKTTGGKA